MEKKQTTHSLDPVAVLLSDPESVYSDILYVYFRIYKKKLLWRFMEYVLSRLKLRPNDKLSIVDIGAASGFDTLYLLRRWTKNFSQNLPCEHVHLSLIEGDPQSIEKGEQLLQASLLSSQVDFKYYHHPLIEKLPLPDASHDIAICSEVVEHLEQPEKLLEEIQRILKPGGFLIMTTDNSPSLLQRLRRIPVLLRGQYKKVYARPSKEAMIAVHACWHGKQYPVYGHINLNPTSHWERLCKKAGFEIVNYGTYESIRRGGGTKSPWALAAYFMAGAIVYHLMPRRIGRYFGDTTALLLRKPLT